MNTARVSALDALRTLAVLGMMAAHTARLVVHPAREGWPAAVLLAEPVIPSLFLFLVGASLAHSRAAAARRGTDAGAWLARQLRRALGLWAISVVFFTLEMGPRVPDMFTASGILANIAYAIVLAGALLALPGRAAAAATGAALALGAAVFVMLDRAGVSVFALNSANSPFLPLWLFAFAGSLGTQWFGRGDATVRARRLGAVAGIALAAVAVSLIARYGYDALFSKPFGRSDAGRTMAAPLTGGNPLHASYYNLRPLLALACLGLHTGALVLLQLLPQAALARFGRLAFAIGRHALGTYVLHLALLAALVTATGTRQPLPAAAHGAGVLLVLFVACQAYAMWRDARVRGQRVAAT